MRTVLAVLSVALAVLAGGPVAAEAPLAAGAPDRLRDVLDAPLSSGASRAAVGAGPVGFGVDVSRYRLLERGRTISLDLRLRWPSADESSERGRLTPYLSLGPALFVSEPDEARWLLDPHADTELAVGLRAGAGVSWQLDPGLSLFGEYRVLRGGEAMTGLGDRSSAAGDLDGFDVFYGLRLRF